MFITKKRYQADLANFERRFSNYKDWVNTQFEKVIHEHGELVAAVAELKAKKTRTRKPKAVEPVTEAVEDVK